MKQECMPFQCLQIWFLLNLKVSFFHSIPSEEMDVPSPCEMIDAGGHDNTAISRSACHVPRSVTHLPCQQSKGSTALHAGCQGQEVKCQQLKDCCQICAMRRCRSLPLLKEQLYCCKCNRRVECQDRTFACATKIALLVIVYCIVQGYRYSQCLQYPQQLLAKPCLHFCRVPLIDAQQYARKLKARKDAPEVKIWVFSEDTHSLDKPQTDFEQWMNVAWWLRKHMQ